MLLDIEMPRMDGYELVAAMRADDRFRVIPIRNRSLLAAVTSIVNVPLKLECSAVSPGNLTKNIDLMKTYMIY